MKGKVLRKAQAAALALVIMSEATPIKPLSQVFEDIAITASAAKQTVEKTVMFKMDGGDSGETTLLASQNLQTVLFPQLLAKPPML